MTDTFIITVPIPKLDPNNQFSGWAAKAAHKKADRETAKEEAMVAVTALGDWKAYGFPWESATVSVRWYHKTTNLKDPDNIIACLKSTIDGIRRAGILKDDDRLRYEPPERLTDKSDPRVEITLVKGARDED